MAPLTHNDASVLRHPAGGGAADELTVDHGEPHQVLVAPQLLRGTQRDAQSHGLDFPLNDVDVAGVQEEDEPSETKQKPVFNSE